MLANLSAVVLLHILKILFKNQSFSQYDKRVFNERNYLVLPFVKNSLITLGN